MNATSRVRLSSWTAGLSTVARTAQIRGVIADAAWGKPGAFAKRIEAVSAFHWLCKQLKCAVASARKTLNWAGLQALALAAAALGPNPGW